MTKIYSKNTVIKQFIIKIGNTEIIFSHTKKYLLIDSIFYNLKIPKGEIKMINLIHSKNIINRILIITESKAKIEYHIGENNKEHNIIYDFFENFLGKNKVIIY